MKIPTNIQGYSDFFYIRGTIHAGSDGFSSASTKCGLRWYSESDSVSVTDSPQESKEVHGDLYGGVKLCPKCFGRKILQYYRDVEAKMLKEKAKRMLKRARELMG